MNRATVLRYVRNITISIVAILIVIVGGGITYIWYVGEHPTDNSAAFAPPAPTVKPRNVTPTQLAPDAKVSASVQSITSPIVPGSNASIMVKTNPTALCKIVVEYNKVASKDSGLIPKKADEYGLVEWTWTVENNAPLGAWPVTVTCANAKNSAMVQNDLKVVKTIE